MHGLGVAFSLLISPASPRSSGKRRVCCSRSGAWGSQPALAAPCCLPRSAARLGDWNFLCPKLHQKNPAPVPSALTRHGFMFLKASKSYASYGIVREQAAFPASSAQKSAESLTQPPREEALLAAAGLRCCNFTQAKPELGLPCPSQPRRSAAALANHTATDRLSPQRERNAACNSSPFCQPDCHSGTSPVRSPQGKRALGGRRELLFATDTGRN